MQTEKSKRNRNKIILAVVLVAIVAAGVLSYYFFFRSTGTTVSPDFRLVVGVTNNHGLPVPDWGNLTDAGQPVTTLLNGTTITLAVGAEANAHFNDFVQLSFTSSLAGVTGTLIPGIVHPLAGGVSAATLNVTAAADVLGRGEYYNFSVTGKSGSITHTLTFPLRIRNTMMHVTPSTIQVGRATDFTAAIGVSDVYNFYAFQFTLEFNSSIITAQTNGVSVSPTFSNPATSFIAQDIVDNQTGSVSLSATLEHQCANGSAVCINSPSPQIFNLVNVTFTSNSTNTGITTLLLTSTILVEQYPGPLPVEDPYQFTNGIVTVMTLPLIHPRTSRPSPDSGLTIIQGITFIVASLVTVSTAPLSRRGRHRSALRRLSAEPRIVRTSFSGNSLNT
jgi:hypothetical protein